jgi:biopolymer transport protein ExbB
LPDLFLKLGVMGWPLLACSVLAMMVFLERSVFVLLSRWSSIQLMDRLQTLLFSHTESPRALREEFVTLALMNAKSPYARGVSLLKMIAAVSPILGLLGTIIGIIGAFQKIAATTDPVTPHLIAEGLWEALLTTAGGLIIALPCVIVATGLTHWRTAIFEKLTNQLSEQSLHMELTRSKSDNNSLVRP